MLILWPRWLRMKGGKLMLERRLGLESELVPTGENRFQMSGIPIKLEVSFTERWPGFRVMLVSTGPGTPLALVYIGSEPAAPPPMTDYVGAFYSEEADATVTAVLKNRRPVLRTRDSEDPQPPRTDFAARGVYPLEPIAGDGFKNDWIGVLRFTRDSQNHISGFVVSNFDGGVRHLEFRKAP